MLKDIEHTCKNTSLHVKVDRHIYKKDSKQFIKFNNFQKKNVYLQ